MNKIVKVEVLDNFVTKLVFDDGKEGIINWSDKINNFPVFEFIKENPHKFNDIQNHQTYVNWIDDDGDEIDFCSDSLYIKATTIHF